jgi:hypothetical protein
MENHHVASACVLMCEEQFQFIPSAAKKVGRVKQMWGAMPVGRQRERAVCPTPVLRGSIWHGVWRPRNLKRTLGQWQQI